MPRFSLEYLNEFATRIFVAAGAPPDIAQRVGESLVRSDLYGVRSHGLQLSRAYVRGIGAGQIQPASRPRVARENPFTALVDGQRAFGRVVAELASETAISKATQQGFAVVCANQCNHVGRIGAYPEMIAEAGLLGFALVNATSRIVTPHGGLQNLFGTNPLAFAVPVPGSEMLLVDFATSAAAANKLRVAANKGSQIPHGWILDKEGAPSADPNDFFDGGYLLPMGAHKGYGLLIMVEVLAGLLSGTGSSVLGEKPGANGLFLMAISPEFFRAPDEFYEDARRLVAELRATPPRDGVDAVLVPGDPEARATAEQRRDGVDYDEVTWNTIRQAALDAGLAEGQIPSEGQISHVHNFR